MSEASEISKKEKPMGIWEILGKATGLGILAAVCCFAAPYVLPTVLITLSPILISVFFTALALLPIALDLFAWPLSGGDFSFTLEIIPAIWTELFPILTTAIPEVIPIIACSPITLAIAGGLAAATFIITTIIITIDCLRENAKIKRKQEQANPKTKENREQEIAKSKEDITQETQKEANQKIPNNVEEPLLGNSNEFPSDDEQSFD